MRSDWDILVKSRWWMCRAQIDVLFYKWKTGQIEIKDQEMLKEFEAVHEGQLKIQTAENPEPPVLMFGRMLDAVFGEPPNGQK